MFEFITQTAKDSPEILVASFILFFVESITIFDCRILQAKKLGNLPSDHPELPLWAQLLRVPGWALKIYLLFLNWKYALAFFVVLFILKVLPVLETIGNILMAPWRPKTGSNNL